MPSARRAKAMAFWARERSGVREGKRGLSWFSRKGARRVVFLQVDFIWLIVETREEMEPVVEEKAAVRGK